MVELSTPVCEFGQKPHDFTLKGVDGQEWSLDKCYGSKGILIMFICNHCPYVLAILDKLVVETDVLQTKGIGVVAINPNDNPSYPDDSFDNMIITSKKYGFGFPYLIDETQQIAKKTCDCRFQHNYSPMDSLSDVMGCDFITVKSSSVIETFTCVFACVRLCMSD